MLCPKCSKPMNPKVSGYGPYWSCSGFPQCRTSFDAKDGDGHPQGHIPHKANGKQVASVPAPTKIQPKPIAKPAIQLVPNSQPKVFKPSKYQQAVFDFISSGHGNAVIEAVAGSGKTTTLVEALKLTSKMLKVAFLAFAVNTKDTLAARAPNWVKVCTLHSLGFAALRAAIPNMSKEPDPDNLYKIVKDLLPEPEDAPLRSPLMKLAGLVKNTLTDAVDLAAVESMAAHYGVETNGDEERLFELLPRVIEICRTQLTTIDYDDMIWLPVVLRLPVEKFDIVFGDEVQDWNACQIELVMKALKPTSRVIAVGDRRQSIFGFRGADINAIPNLIKRLNATVLPLSICYRCPKSHVEMAKEIVPQIEASETAIEGVIEYVDYQVAVKQMTDGQMVLCRVNAALVSCAYKLIKRGQKAIIRGRNFADDLIGLIDKLQPKDIIDLVVKVEQYKQNEIAKLEAKGGRETQIQNMMDKCDTLSEMTEGMADLFELRDRIDTIFNDKSKEGVILSTVHRAKGDENKDVWILRPELMPMKSTQAWQAEQEENIRYVAYTRSKMNLRFVEGM